LHGNTTPEKGKEVFTHGKRLISPTRCGNLPTKRWYFTSKMLGFNQPYLGKLPIEFGMLPAICVILPAKQGKATEKIPKRKI
jgi:hypothetical protein